MITEYSFYWDSIVKALADEVIKKVTVDEAAIKYYVSGMMWAVEHDLADGRGRGLKALNSLIQISGVFSSDNYFNEIHKDTSKEEIERMKNLGKEVKKLLKMNDREEYHVSNDKM